MENYELQAWLWPQKGKETQVKNWEEGSLLTILRRYDTISEWELVEITGSGGGIVPCDVQTAANILDWLDEGAHVTCTLLKKEENGRILVSFEKDS